ncbi:HNH endonuclease [Patescibacteria group bacterium]|nr:HNH endonuclease [Patescibacteria group bacterium]
MIIIRKKKWNKDELEKASKESTSIRQVLKKLRLKEAGGNYSQIKKYLNLYKINILHFKGKGWNKGLKGIGKPIIPLEKILVKNSNYQSYKLKNRLFIKKIKLPKCEECGWAKISNDGRLPLELDHINGDSKDNRLDNLRILCPNCHSLKPTHRGKNRKKKGSVAERHTRNT